MLNIAPVQGHTDAAWRHFHHDIYGGENIYYTPFIRLEKGDFRKHDLKDYTSELNKELTVVPQVIFRDMEELTALVDGLAEKGANCIDLNSGCPFPLQTARGRGAAVVDNKELYSQIPEFIENRPDIKFSLKMRLGMENPEEWKDIIGYINDSRLEHVALHPRVAKQQYGGELNLEQFKQFLAECKNPVIYNGELKTPADIADVYDKFPEIAGVMTGRGILGRPSLLAEYESGEEWSQEKRISAMLEFHSQLIDHYRETLCGDHQILSKIKPFWEYAEAEIGRKPWKMISKASNMAKYQSAVAMI